MEPGFTPEVMALLFAVAALAGCVDTLAGGGGLIVLPALILSGLPPLQALGTNKLQSTMGTATASVMMLRHKRVSWPTVKYLMLSAFVGATAGTLSIQFINPAMLGLVIPAVLVLIAFYFLFAGRLIGVSTLPRVSNPVYRYLVVPVIGWYDGMFGPGTGSFFAFSGTALQGRNLIDATAIAKTLNFATNSASLIIFIIADQVVWLTGLVMMAGQIAGAWLGSHMLLKIKPEHLRMFVVLVCLIMLARYAGFW